MAAVAAFSVAVERLLYVHLYGASELDQVLLTVGINFIVVAGLTLAFGPNVLPSRLPPSLAASVDLGIRSFETYRLVVLAVGVVVIVALWLVFERTSFGARLRAAVDNRTMAESVGIDVPRLFSIAFAVGSALAAIGGAVGAPILPFEPMYPFKYLVMILIIVAMSGFGNVKLAPFVSIFVGIVDTAARYFYPESGSFLALCLVDRPDRLAAGRPDRLPERPMNAPCRRSRSAIGCAVGASLVADRHRLVLLVSAVPVRRHLDPGDGAVRAVDRPADRLHRHRFVRPRGVVRHRRLRVPPDRSGWLQRTDHGRARERHASALFALVVGPLSCA